MEVEAEMDTREWTKPIATGDYISMRNAYMKVHGRLEDKVTPSKEYLEKKLQELENGEFRAETMTEVVSKDEVDPDVLVPIFDSKGSLSVKKGASTIPLPTGPEQLRRRLTVMVNAILMLAIKHTNREEIQDVTRDLFERYKDYVLGTMYGAFLQQTSKATRFNRRLDLGAFIRAGDQKEGILVDDHRWPQIGAALEQAWKCPTTKERHFITPLALYSKRSYPQQSWGDWNPKGKGQSRQILWCKREIERKRNWSYAGWSKDLLSLQPGQVQLSEVQILTCVQQMLQEGAQCTELQGGEAPPGHYRGTLTGWYRQCTVTRPYFKEDLQGFVRFFGEAAEEFSFIMATQAVKATWSGCGSGDGRHTSETILRSHPCRGATTLVKQDCFWTV